MRKLDWYIFRKFIGTFFFAISLLIVVVIVFDVSENVDSFIKNNASLYEVVFHYYIPFIPYFINLFIYLFTFISVIFPSPLSILKDLSSLSDKLSNIFYP